MSHILLKNRYHSFEKKLQKKQKKSIHSNKKMEHIKIYTAGNIKMTTIRLNGLMVVIIRNECDEKTDDKDLWFGISRKVKSFKEITTIEKLKTMYLKATE